MSLVYLLEVKIRNKVLYEVLRDLYEFGCFRERARYAYNSVSENISSILAEPGKDGYEICFSISYDGSYKFVPRVLCDVLPCFLIQLRTLFEINDKTFVAIKELILNKRVEIDMSYDYVSWHVSNFYPDEQPNRIDEGFYIDRARNRTWYSSEEYYKNLGNLFGLLTGEKKHEEELAKSAYSEAIKDYPQNNKFKEIFPQADPDSASENYDKSFEIVSDDDRETKQKTATKESSSEKEAEKTEVSDKQALIKLVENDPHLLDSLPASYRGDKEVVMAAVKSKPLLLGIAAADLQNDKEVVLLAVNQMGLALKFASKELQADEEVVLAAVKNDGWALQYASYELMGNRQIVLAAVEKVGIMLAYASQELRNDKEIILKAIDQNGKAYIFISNFLKNDQDVVEAVKKWLE